MDFHLPELGEGVYEAEFVAWMVKPGDTVKAGQNLFEVLTDKATMEVPAPFAGKIAELLVKPGQKVKIGEAMLRYTPSGEKAPARSREIAAAAPQQIERRERQAVGTSRLSGATVKAAPSVRYLARKLGVDLGTVHGSGPEGRVLIEDLSAHVKPHAGEVNNKPAAVPVQDFGKPGTRLKLLGLRRAIAEHMVQSKRTIPHYSYVEECDVTNLVLLREQLRDDCTRRGVKLTYLAFFVKAAVAALKEVPLVNASLDDKEQEIVLHDRYHIGIAAATPGGLIVPVVHDADKKDLLSIAQEIDRLTTAARAGKIKREDVKGGTFTVTSVGNLGGLISTPVINYPEVGILGVGKIVKRPVYDDTGQIKPADMLYLSLSFDHRVVDGAVGAAFTNAIVRHLLRPAAMLLPASS